MTGRRITSVFGWLLVASVVAVAEDGEIISAKLAGGFEGRYMLFVPPQAKEGRKLPLIVALHGAGGKPDGPIKWWQKIAAERGYFVLAPKSNGATWPGGDQSHVTRMVLALERERPIDSRRVLLTGVSDGGAWSYVLGFENPRLFAALAPISGTLPRATAGSLAMQPKLPICVVHGTEDRIFIVARAQATVKALKSAHYNVNYIEVAGGRHGWFREQAPAILDWFEKLQPL